MVMVQLKRQSATAVVAKLTMKKDEYEEEDDDEEGWDEEKD
jgi:hypothetical protein